MPIARPDGRQARKALEELTKSTLKQLRVVLNQPKDPVNVGAVVRAMKNMGLTHLDLVRPLNFDAHRVEGVAHTGMDIIESARWFDRLPEALAGARLVVGTTARGRRARRNYRRPREIADEIVEASRSGEEVALVFGREDSGLTNEELDLCGRVVVVPTDPDHSSLNLAQAVLIVAYEIWLAANPGQPFKAPRRRAPRARQEELEEMIEEIEASLRAVDFFKSHRPAPILRTIRGVAARADLDQREAALLKAMAYEVRHFIARRGLGNPQGE